MSAIVLLAVACSSTASNPLGDYEQVIPAQDLESPAVAANGEYDAELVDHGRYLVTLLGCGSCHTDGALTGAANPDRLLAGSSVGIAYTSPLAQEHPGVIYPSNLTPDMDTGLGSWTEQQIVDMIRTGTDKHGSIALSVMPWTAYRAMKDADARAITAYLRSLPPVRHKVPRNVIPGEEAPAPFIHFGIYRSRE